MQGARATFGGWRSEPKKRAELIDRDVDSGVDWPLLRLNLNSQAESPFPNTLACSLPPMIDHAAETILCRCLQVTRSQVETAVAVGGCQSVRDVSQATGAGRACMACHCRIKQLLRAAQTTHAAAECMAADVA